VTAAAGPRAITSRAVRLVSSTASRYLGAGSAFGSANDAHMALTAEDKRQWRGYRPPRPALRRRPGRPYRTNRAISPSTPATMAAIGPTGNDESGEQERAYEWCDRDIQGPSSRPDGDELGPHGVV